MHPHASSSSSTSYTSQDPPPRSELWWDRIPSIKIVRPPKGPFSPQVDERCFTYCSQSITGRIHGHDPWCRTICIRKVFLHEVTRILSRHQTETIHKQPGKPTRREITEVIEAAPVNHPLPPEGQRYSGWLHAMFEATVGGLVAPQEDSATGAGPPETKYWKEGWYFWWSRSRWAAQERMDLMRRSLESQTEWQQLKERRNEEWERGASYDEHRLNEDVRVLGDHGNAPPFPDVSHESILLPLPDTFPLGEQMRNVLAPTWKVLGVVRESVASGAQKELAQRLFEKALSDEPIKLLRVASSMIWENMGFKDDDDSKSSDTRKKP
ncbi:hypothetical protein GY45DRAFT_1359892 [Cubamyces sp. BRFM 1775]|nr:hypothetical protein GY45DRAFT_1359892 [Cubamyces sp. BRFM 1775]